jgi:Protein of unknown function (DUF2917)
MAHLSTHYERPAPAPWEGALARGQIVRLAPAAVPRWIQVMRGRLWLTATASTIGHHADCWLIAGERLALPAGSEWLVEADLPAADVAAAVAADADAESRYLLLEAPPARRAPARGLAAAWAAAARRALSAAWTASRAHGAIRAGDSMASAGTVR